MSEVRAKSEQNQSEFTPKYPAWIDRTVINLVHILEYGKHTDLTNNSEKSPPVCFV